MRNICLLAWLLLPVSLSAQAPAPGQLRRYFCTSDPGPPTAWAEWQINQPPLLQLLKRPRPSFERVRLPQLSANPYDNPFEDNLTLYHTGPYQFGVSGFRGFNLRDFPRTLPKLLGLLRLRNLLRLRQWIQPESNELRLQNLVGASFYFYF
jgi:hypothetical protein